MAPHERHFNVAGAAGAPAAMNFDTPSASDGSGAQFINLANLANLRDNNREAVVDYLNLSASLGNLKTEVANSLGANIDIDNMYVVGVSLGGILSTVFTSVNQLAIANETKLGITPVLKPIRGLVLASSGTQVSQIMINSPTFSPSINAGLAASGVVAGTTNYERFIYTAQSMLDSGDAVSFAQSFKQLDLPVLIQQVKDDQVIVNSTQRSPLAGTESLASLMGATALAAGDTFTGIGMLRMNAGGHTSLLRIENNAPLVTLELQTQVVAFVLNKGLIVAGAGAASTIQAP
jgi:predicted alpha/beta hydrolase